MPPIWKPQPLDVLQNWIETIEDEASDQLNDWETRFIDDMRRIVILHRRPLTRSQEETLEKIYAEKTS